LILHGTPKAKAACWGFADDQLRKRGHKKGLDKSCVGFDQPNGVPLDSDIRVRI